ncbi:hypothetical protein NIES21_53410 [Anabaenopsis circularis NIES-21]|uniref:DUF2974 domain-containing protein n=1 Tax=Anabaenopsis circularis NIES-21 TaxID=1085406 RepID=A0A1Z4GQ41_9CYAN|nr:hypothetical protein NIES21_53410 [Anabaenopsis circularis NIES-21]
MYKRQHRTGKASANQSDTPVNQFAPRPFVVPTEAEDTIQTPDLQAQQVRNNTLLPSHNFANIPIFPPGYQPPPPPRLQMKLAIGEPGDEYEQETNAVIKAIQRVHTPIVGNIQHSQTQILNRDIDPSQVKEGTTSINPQDINLEKIGHGLIYHDVLTDQDKEWLREQGFKEQWFPDGNVVNAGSGLNYGLLLPTEAGVTAGKHAVLAFRGTSDLATAWQDLDINSPGHGGIQNLLKEVPTGYIGNIVSQSGKLDVTGHSLGGALAQHFVGTHPTLVRRLVTFQSAAPNAKQYHNNIDSLSEEERPEVVHHIAKGDIVDLAGGEHLKGTFFEHDLETSGLANVSTLARIKQAHTSQLLNTEDIIGEAGHGNHTKDITMTENATRPYTKSRLVEAGRMMALNKGTAVAGGLLVGAAGLAGTAIEVPTRLAYKGLTKAGSAIASGASIAGSAIASGASIAGSAIASGASSLYENVTNYFSGNKEE